MIILVQTVNAENKVRKSNKCKNKLIYKNTLKYKNNQGKVWKCISINIEECASKCTYQIPPHLNFCTPSKIKSKLKKKHTTTFTHSRLQTLLWLRLHQ